MDQPRHATEEALTIGTGLWNVRAFWNTEACGTHFVKKYVDRRDFFRKYREFRYRTEWHIPQFAEFPRAAGKLVLEIGCGNGADGAMFAMQGANYTGIDLTAAAVNATREHFECEGLKGEFHQANAERLDFPHEHFDLVYSFGVLHHTPDPAAAVREVHRVLKPGGVAKVMLYHRDSFNYYVRILGYMRARLLCTILLRAGRWHADRRKLRSGLTGMRGNARREMWRLHYENFLRKGWAYLAAQSFAHHCADGPECPLAFTYTRRDAVALFGQFSALQMRVAHLPLNKYQVGRFLPRAVEQWAASRMGWNLLITATK